MAETNRRQSPRQTTDAEERLKIDMAAKRSKKRQQKQNGSAGFSGSAT